MKTVKRKAEVGERVLYKPNNTTHKVERAHLFGVTTTKNLSLSHDKYEVIIEDEPGIPPHSSHYHQNGLDPLEVMRRTFPPEQYEGFLRGSLLKYAMRYDRKGQQQADLEKLNFYGRELEQWKNALKDADGNVIFPEDAE